MRRRCDIGAKKMRTFWRKRSRAVVKVAKLTGFADLPFPATRPVRSKPRTKPGLAGENETPTMINTELFLNSDPAVQLQPHAVSRIDDFGLRKQFARSG
jgi:hypothetical protein